MNPENLLFTGTQINYFLVCQRKLWFFSKSISQEHTSDIVQLGRLLHETSYKRKFKEIQIGPIKIDFLDKKCEIHEVKKSKKIEKAHEYQLLYYLYFLKKKGIEELKGVIDYPLLKQRIEVFLTPEKEAEIEQIIEGIKQVISQEIPPKAVKKAFCRKCSYFEMCKV